MIKLKTWLARLVRPGNKARFKFDTSSLLAPGEKVRSDKAGFRFLVEDADGGTVVDPDLPSNSASRNIRNTGNKYRGQGPWSVPKDKRSLRYRSEGVDGQDQSIGQANQRMVYASAEGGLRIAKARNDLLGAVRAKPVGEAGSRPRRDILLDRLPVVLLQRVALFPPDLLERGAYGHEPTQRLEHLA